LNAMQAQLAQTKAQAAAAKQQANTAQQQASTAQQQASASLQNMQNIPPNLYNADLPIPTKGPSFFDTIHVSLAGSFIAMEGAWRERNEVSSGATDPQFSNLPYGNSPLFYENELRFAAQQSRLALAATGDIDPAQHVKGYWESDFICSSVNANSRESNSYCLRIRQAYFGYANDNWGAHFSAGQMWSLATQNRVGILNGTENTPLTIDAQYVVGFNWARQPSIRWVEDWNKVAWFAVSVESPQVNFNSNTSLSPSGGTVAPPGFAVNINSEALAGSSGLNTTTGYSNDLAPDIIEKAAIDPGWGHYEALAIQRFFTDEVAVLPPGVAAAGLPWSTKTNFAWGVGGNALVPVWPKIFDLQGSVLGGSGIGRYASGQLPDATIGPNGQLSPIREIEFLVGGVVHPWAGSDWYAYYGQEQEARNSWTVAGVNGGWGNPLYAMSGCGLTAPVSTAATGTAYNINSGTTCIGNVQRLQEVTVGFWQDFYKGDLGRMRYGLQYEYVQADLFSGAVPAGSGAPAGLHPNNNIVFFSLRYYPFN
jgi:hypothetical protein